MKRVLILLVCAAAIALPAHLSAQAAPPAASAAKGRIIEIEATDAMKYSVTQIQAKPGETVTVSLKILGKMPKGAMDHNFVLLKEGVDPTKFANEAMMAAATGYIPAARKGDVIAASPLGFGGQTVEVTFKAPTKAGAYTYLCSFPGHFLAGMRGTLTVK